MSVSRRDFIGGCSALLAARAFGASESPVLRVGILSDTHVSLDPKSQIPLQRAFSYFSSEGVGAVALAGDVCECGTLDELKTVMDAWRAVFPDGRNRHGGVVRPFFIWGNHDYHASAVLHGKGPMTDAERQAAILTNKDAAWEMVTGEPRHSGEVFLRTIGGITFIGAHWGAEAAAGRFLREHAAELPADRPIVYLQHKHPKNTCFRGWASGDDGANRAALLEHPNVFVISGHSHTPVYDDALWMGGFASMGAGSLLKPAFRRYEYNGLWYGKQDVRHMRNAKPGDAAQVSVMSIYPDRVVVSRHDVNHDEAIGDDWELPFPFRHNAERPYCIADNARPPQFAAGSEISLSFEMGECSPGHVRERQTVIRFPAARSDGPHSRVIDYRVRVTGAGGRSVIERLVQQDFLACAESRAVTHPGVCVFGPEELPVGETLSVGVAPLNCGGIAGRPISRTFSVC